MTLLQKPSQYRRLLLAALGLQLILLLQLLTFLPAALQPLLMLVGFLIIPGTLSALILYRNSGMPFWQIFGLGIGLGIGEALLWGRLLIAVHASTPYLGYVLLGTSMIKIAWLWRQNLTFRKNSFSVDWRLFVIPLVLLFIIWLTIIQVNLNYPPYPVNTFRINDKWSYLTVIEQFLSSPSQLNLRPDAIIIGSNTRLSWSSWLYFTAFVSNFTHIHPIQLIFQYFRPSLVVITFLSSYFLGYQLFRKHWLALLASVLNLLFAIGLNVEAFWFWMRMEEDKYFAFMTLMPFAWIFLLRALKNRQWADIAGLMAVSLSLALVHPLGIPGLLLTSAPIALVEWYLNRCKGFTLQWLLVILFSMSIFIGITRLDQVMVLATPYVQQYIATNGSLPAYNAATVSSLLPVNARFIYALLIPLAFFARKDRVARFLFLMSAACVVVLSVPIVTSLVSKFTTSVGIDRYNWLIPYGFIATWLIARVSQRLPISPSKWRYQLALIATMIAGVILISGWSQWTERQQPWVLRQELDEPTILSEGEWQGLLDTAQDTAHKRAITPTDYGLVTPTLWPDANLLFFNSPIHAPLYWPKVEALYLTQDIATTWMLLDDLQPQILMVPSQNNLLKQFAKNPEGIRSLYTNDALQLFAIDTPEALRNKEDAFALVANQYTLMPGECTQLSWDSVDISELQLDDTVVEGKGSQEVCPTQNTTYTLQGKRLDGSVITQAQHIFVSEDYNYLATFDADRFVVKPGECVNFYWHVEGIDKVYFQGAATVGESTANECPAKDTLYTLSVILRTQETILRNITVYVRE